MFAFPATPALLADFAQRGFTLRAVGEQLSVAGFRVDHCRPRSDPRTSNWRALRITHGVTPPRSYPHPAGSGSDHNCVPRSVQNGRVEWESESVPSVTDSAQ